MACNPHSYQGKCDYEFPQAGKSLAWWESQIDQKIEANENMPFEIKSNLGDLTPEMAGRLISIYQRAGWSDKIKYVYDENKNVWVINLFKKTHFE